MTSVGIRRPRTLDLAQQLHLVDADQGDGVAVTLGPAGPADAMDVILGDHRQFEVDDVRQGIDIQSARGDLGRHQDGEPSGLEVGQSPDALRLALLPWIAVALMPSFSSWSARRLAPCLVRVKTSAWSMRPDVMR